MTTRASDNLRGMSIRMVNMAGPFVDRSMLIDGAIVVAITVYGAIWLNTAESSPGIADYVTLALAAGVLVVRRRFPVWVVGTLLALRIVGAAFDQGDAVVTMSLFVACFTVAERRRPFVVAAVGTLAAGVFVGTTLTMGLGFDLGIASSTIGFFGAAIGAGWAVASQRRLAAQQALVVERDLAAARLGAETAARAEREKLAADLHDVLAHHVNVTVVLAESGRFTRNDDRSSTFEMIATSGRRALSELDRILVLLQQRRGTLPAPDITRVDELVQPVVAAGFDVTLESTGDLKQLDTATSTTLYRIVQESLTNVVKHSPARWVRIHLDARAELVRLEVVSAATAAMELHAGRGLNGLAERTGLVGGTLAITNNDERFEVSASIPLRTSAQ